MTIIASKFEKYYYKKGILIIGIGIILLMVAGSF